MKVLITGGHGFVGRHFTKRLSDQGHEVSVVDSLINKSTWPKHLKCEFKFIEEDCRNFFCENKDNWDLVIHLAAIVGGRAHMEGDPLSVAEDLSIDASFFKWATTNRDKIGHVVYFSSSAAYPIKFQTHESHTPLSEDMINLEGDIGLPDLTYGWSKLTGEYLAKIAAEKYNIKVACYRPFSGYGEDQDEVYPFIGILKRVINKEIPIKIWSDSVRDFIYIEDIVTWVLDTYKNSTDGSAINLGSGKGTSFSELAKLMYKIVHNQDTEVVIENNMPKGVYYRVASQGPSFELTSLEDGIRKALPVNMP
jgi:GDP-L-fucose synthase